MSNLIVNFGGPRSLEEIEPFLTALLNDRDVIWSKLPAFLHRLLFTRLARKRAVKIAPDYALIGGRSPIFDDTEAIAREVSQRMGTKVLAFHRYLPATHSAALASLAHDPAPEIRIFPMFPQFSYATTGSIARFFSENLPPETVRKMRWIKSYPAHPAYVRVMQAKIQHHLDEHGIAREKAVLLFSAHGVPQEFILKGDIYESECRLSYDAIRAAFPKAIHKLAYQSKFGPDEWLSPSTQDACETIHSWAEGRENVVIIPLTFTSDHIETLFEIEHLYLPVLRAQGVEATRCSALNREWTNAIMEILGETNLSTTEMLFRNGALRR